MTEHGAAPSDPIYVARVANLADLPRLPAGATVLVWEPDDLVIALGAPPAGVVAIPGWSARNVWLRDAERRDVAVRHPIFGSPVAVAAAILSAPLAVHEDRRQADVTYFIAESQALRDIGITVPRSARYVDLAVQSHRVGGTTLYRVFHLAPTRQNKGARRLWP